jgi:hypothetical protein
MLVALPSLANDLREIAEPHSACSNRDSAVIITDFLPTLETLMELPMRAMARRLRLLPQCTKFNIEALLPHRPNDRKLKLLPIWVARRMDSRKHDDAAQQPRHDKFEPKRIKDRKDNDDPRLL